jgi:hypothetical protein
LTLFVPVCILPYYGSAGYIVCIQDARYAQDQGQTQGLSL